jgi:hypothetical protein
MHFLFWLDSFAKGAMRIDEVAVPSPEDQVISEKF